MIFTGILGAVIGVNLMASAVLRQRVGQSWRGQLSIGAALVTGGYAMILWGMLS